MPALILELDRLPARFGAVGMRMIVPQFELGRRRHRRLLPELFDCFMVDLVVQRHEENASQLAVMKTRVQAFEASQLLPHLLRDLRRTAAGHDLKRTREQPQHALLVESTREGAY